MKTSKPGKRTEDIVPNSAVAAAFYSMEDLRRRCGSPTKVASRSKIYRLIAACIIPRRLPDLNAWSAVEVDDALARLASKGGRRPEPEGASPARRVGQFLSRRSKPAGEATR